jgi:hypothetical protein
MVTFKLIEENDTELIYHYFPEGKIVGGYGKIRFDRINSIINVVKLASEDYTKVISKEEVNSLRDSVIKMSIEEGLPEITEEDWPTAKEDILNTKYADHAISRILESLNNGVILKEDMVAWY